MPDIFLPSSSRPSAEARLYDSARRDFNRFFFSMERPLRSLDLSERFRGAESDNERGSREGLPSSHCGACVPVGVFHRGRREGRGGWLVYVEMNCFYGPVNWVGARRSTPAAAFQSVAGAPFRGPGHALGTAPHRWLIPPLAALVGGSTRGLRRLTGP